MKNQCQIYKKRSSEQIWADWIGSREKMCDFWFNTYNRNGSSLSYGRIKSMCENKVFVWMYSMFSQRCVTHTRSQSQSQSQNHSVYMFILSFFSLLSGSFPFNIFTACANFFACPSILIPTLLLAKTNTSVGFGLSWPIVACLKRSAPSRKPQRSFVNKNKNFSYEFYTPWQNINIANLSPVTTIKHQKRAYT